MVEAPAPSMNASRANGENNSSRANTTKSARKEERQRQKLAHRGMGMMMLAIPKAAWIPS